MAEPHPGAKAVEWESPDDVSIDVPPCRALGACLRRSDRRVRVQGGWLARGHRRQHFRQREQQRRRQWQLERRERRRQQQRYRQQRRDGRVRSERQRNDRGGDPALARRCVRVLVADGAAAGAQRVHDARLFAFDDDGRQVDGVTNAIDSFVQQPTSGISVGMQYFAQSAPPPDGGAAAGLFCLIPAVCDSCDPAAYAMPAIEIAPLPGVASQITASLAAHTGPTRRRPRGPRSKAPSIT